MRIVLFGPPGAGKGTQAALLVARKGLRHVSTGNIIRDAMTSDSPVGIEAGGYVESGQLVPDRLVSRMAQDALEQIGCDDFVLDGYPRTIDQALWLDGFLDGLGKSLHAVLSIQVPDEQIVARLSRRRLNKETGETYHLDYSPPPDWVPDHLIIQRDDDQPAAIQHRLNEYREKTLPLETYFAEQGKLVTVDGAGRIDQVQDRIDASLLEFV